MTEGVPDRGAQAWLIGGAALAVFAAAALVWAGVPAQGHSTDYNLIWLAAFENALASGDPYPRNLPDLWDGLGGLDFFFYAPLPFYLAAGPARWLCGGACDDATVLALAGGMLWAASGLTFWPLARRFVSRAAAAAGCLLYMVLPYHLAVDWFTRQALGEFAAYVFLPVVALGVFDLFEGRFSRGAVALPLGAAAMLVTHLPSALLAAHVLALVVAGYLAAGGRPALPALGRGALFAACGALIAAVYWLPALVLLDDVSASAFTEPGLRPEDWVLFGGAFSGDPALRAMLLASAGVAAIASVAALALSGPDHRVRVLLWCIVPVIAVFFLNSGLSAPLWDHWIIRGVQFPFRALQVSDLAAALAAAIVVERLSEGRRGFTLGLGAAALLAICVPPSLAGVQAIFSGGRAGPPPMVGAVEYLPPEAYAPFAAEQERTSPYWLAWRRTIEDRRQSFPELDAIAPDAQTSRRWVFLDPPAGESVLAVHYWRHLGATADGSPIGMEAEPSWGMVHVTVPEGTARLEVRIPRHWSETAGAILTLIGLAGLTLLALRSRRAAAVGQREGDNDN